MNETFANLVGSAAAICSVTSFAPQGIKIWKERDASAVSLKTYSLTVSCFILWVVYGVLTQAWPVTVANSCALIMASGVLVMKWRFRDGDPKSDAKLAGDEPGAVAADHGHRQGLARREGTNAPAYAIDMERENTMTVGAEEDDPRRSPNRKQADDARSGLAQGGLGGAGTELLDSGQEEVFSRAEVESGRIEHHTGETATHARLEARKPEEI